MTQIQTAHSGDLEASVIAATPLKSDVTESVEVLSELSWNGPDDPDNPWNWSSSRKWAITILMSLASLVTLMSGAMVAPALPKISKDLHMSDEAANMALSIFILAFAFGPMVLAPATEIYGRRNVWLVCATWYTVWNAVCGFVHNGGFLLAARLLAGVGASAEFAVIVPVLADCWRPEQRGRSFAIASFLPLLGPALGPVLGGAISQSVSWQWLFWVLSIFCALLIFVGFFTFPETCKPVLLRRRAARAAETTHEAQRTPAKRLKLSDSQLHAIVQNLIRPWKMLATQPIVQIMSILLAVNFGTLYFVLSSFATVWTEQYHESATASGLHYFSIAIGYTIAAQGGAPATDRLWRYLSRRAGGQTAPEYRVPLILPGTILVPVGLLMYGWAAQHKLHWIIVDIGAAISGCGAVLSTTAMQQYVVEAYFDHVASASAASQFLRSIFAFAFPLFAPKLYKTLGLGWGNSVLALLTCVLVLPGPFILWRYGAALRARGSRVT